LRIKKPPQKPARKDQITVQTYYRWREEYGGLKPDDAKRPQELKSENAKLKGLVTGLSLEKEVSMDEVGGSF
jgi:putative transposase